MVHNAKSKINTPLRKTYTPQQGRSRDSLQRMLDATEKLLAMKTFDELTITDVVKKSKTSVGAFYGRFSNKDALLDALYDRYQRQMQNSLQSLTNPQHWKNNTTREMIEQIIHFTVNIHRQQRGLLRTLVLRGYLQPDWRYQVPQERNKLSLVKVGELLASRKSEIRHPNPKQAASLGFLTVLATLREKILFSDSTASAITLSDQELERELVKMFCAYLGVEQSKVSKQRGKS